MGHMVEQIPTKEFLFVLVDANASTGNGMEGCGDCRVLAAYGRDELNSNGKHLLAFASDNKLAVTNTFFSARKGGISHTFNGISNRNDQKRTEYILTRQAHRSRAHDAEVHPQPRPPAKADSDHNMGCAMVRLSGRFRPNGHVQTKNKFGLSTSRSFDPTEIAGSESWRGSFPSFPCLSRNRTVSLRWLNPLLMLFLVQ